MIRLFRNAKAHFVFNMMVRVQSKISALRAIPHTSGYSKWEGDRRIALLSVKYNKLANQYEALSQ